MEKIRINLLLGIAVLLMVFSPLSGESISLKISYNNGAVSKGDLNTWIDSYNTLWADWRAYNNGQLTGQLEQLKYGPKYEVEIRIPLILGLSFNLAGSHFKDSKEGAISFADGTSDQSENDFVRNEVQGIPIKIGLSYSQVLPFSKNLYLFAGVGRHITFLKYNFFEDTELKIGDQNSYILKKDYSYNSEALGFYVTFGAEYDLIKQIAIVIEGEKVWSKADGFKGPYETEFYDPFSNTKTTEEGKASLYFYEKQHGWSSSYYSSLAGHKTKPSDPEDYPVGVTDIQSLRQGEIDLSSFSFKIGIRFKF
jgi:hypothetical protein